jgi:hypothetical protein
MPGPYAVELAVVDGDSSVNTLRKLNSYSG